jgi:hypothetical protein
MDTCRSMVNGQWSKIRVTCNLKPETGQPVTGNRQPYSSSTIFSLILYSSISMSDMYFLISSSSYSCR